MFIIAICHGSRTGCDPFVKILKTSQKEFCKFSEQKIAQPRLNDLGAKFIAKKLNFCKGDIDYMFNIEHYSTVE
jgi:hypothetical protein